MEKKSKGSPVSVPAVSLDRARRLIRLVQLLGAGAQARAKLMRPLRLDVRGFYRDLQCLRAAKIEVTLEDGKYSLLGKQEDALARVPFPDPGLSYGEAVVLAKGNTAPHQRLKRLVKELVTPANNQAPAPAKSKAKKSR
jgi:hypothetical protein